MKRKNNILQKVIFYIILLILILPLIQMQFKIFNKNELKGAITKIERPEFSLETWFNEVYQNNYEKYVNQNFGGRNRLIRINNQIAFSIYKIAKANGVIIGKDNYLFESNYIKAYYGDDFVGKKKIENNIIKLKEIQDTLNHYNTKILVILAAGKGSFYHEYIPDKFKKPKTLTNMEFYEETLEKYNIDHIDFNSFFQSAKDTSRYPLYPKTGIHWSVFGVHYVIDSISKYIEKNSNIDLPDMQWNNIDLTDDYLYTDVDIEEGMNLLFSLSNFPMAYPDVKVNSKNKVKPKLITISDSFFWKMFSSGLAGKYFSDIQFWFYYKENHSNKPMIELTSVDKKKEIENTDIIILLATEATLPGFAWGFIDETYETYYGDYDEITLDQKISKYIDMIQKNKKWYDLIIEKAEKKGIPVDSMLYLDALYMINKSGK